MEERERRAERGEERRSGQATRGQTTLNPTQRQCVLAGKHGAKNKQARRGMFKTFIRVLQATQINDVL